MAQLEMIPVEVTYGHRDSQALLALRVPVGATVKEAIERSGILRRFPEINLEENKVGIFGKVCGLDTSLRDKDRVEIYRPLIADPKESRRKRAEKKESE